MNSDLMKLSAFSRRCFVERAAKSFLGVSLGSLAGRALAAGGANLPDYPKGKGKAKSIIYLFMDGGMSHLDTLDPKPEKKDVQGPIGAIQTKIPGVQFGSVLPKLAQRADKFAVVRSLHHTMGNHEIGKYKVWTGYEQQTGITHPAMGAWVAKQAERLNPNLPSYVKMGGLAGHPANGFFEVKHAPLPITSPTEGIQNVKLRGEMTMDEFRRDLSLAQRIDRNFLARFDSKQVRAYGDLYKDAIAMMTSKDLGAFDIGKEPKEVQQRYGDDDFGKGCLLARRLVEHGVRFVEVSLGGWDTHTDNHKGVADRAKTLDGVLSALLDDLAAKGLIDSTLVVLTTEFGRSPKIDEYAGRNHFPIAYSSILAGGGVQGGQVHGKTSADGSYVVDGMIRPWELNSTIAYALGLDIYNMEMPFPGGQLFSIAGKDTQIDKAQPLTNLFS
ncbi:DUF1501 domain-containing protein [Stratiformator vulcanicus]|uniref:Sulfatase n=1 Tax=Stratiformator vulcanicus TaxID=2527980 RepID=A0A517QZB1_9PLAN|nr:DUF1501 domain-containing protein [Stratiformator vulcanicus]QDT36880.1 hypothetical protein Pan189_12440 [Stratiformator vulcanicus]